MSNQALSLGFGKDTQKLQMGRIHTGPAGVGHLADEATGQGLVNMSTSNNVKIISSPHSHVNGYLKKRNGLLTTS